MVLFNHWFMPYKVERGRISFQCGTSTKLPRSTHEFPWSKNCPHTYIYIYIYIYTVMIISLFFNPYAALCSNWIMFFTYSRSKGGMVRFYDQYWPRRLLLCPFAKQFYRGEDYLLSPTCVSRTYLAFHNLLSSNRSDFFKEYKSWVFQL